MATPRTLDLPDPSPTAAAPRRAGRFDAPAVGLLAVLTAGLALGRPGLWFDEIATRVAVDRTPAQLAGLLTRVDVVHGAYYALLQPWVALAGSSPVALRLPSALAVGAAAAGTVVLARALAGRRYAVVTGAVVLLLPRMTAMGIEARSGALVTALATWWTVALLVALRRGGRVRWAVTGVLGVAATLVFVYAGLLVLTQAVSLVLARRAVPPRGWWPGALAVLATTGALGAAAAGQAAQVDWLPQISALTLELLGVEQFFPGSRPLALVAWVLVLVGVAGSVSRVRGGGAAVPRVLPGPLQLALPWLVVPPVLLVAASLLGDPLYYPRYVAFTTPALALLVALPLARWRRDWRPTAAVGVLAALAAPAVVEQRHVSAKSDYALVAAEVRRVSQPGDAVLWGPLDVFPSDTRVIAVAYPEAFEALRDPTLGEPRSVSGGLWSGTRPLATVLDELQGTDRVVVVRDTVLPLDDGDLRLLAQAGFAPAGRWDGPATDVLRFERVAAG